MCLQEYRIHLINNQVIKAAEERFIPVRNILYVSMDQDVDC